MMNARTHTHTHTHINTLDKEIEHADGRLRGH